ncbi:MAG TPA: hypothetical protein VM616_01110 [Gammaproteobacteria bacterium]|nr:hypothetical protein [Gammaproteobacteria bacterium]
MSSLVGVLAPALLAGVIALPVPQAQAQAQADVCYQDSSGRILTRRRPGAVEVPCPGAEAPAVQPEGAEPPATYERRGVQRRPPVVDTRRQNPVSPVPRPALADYVASVPIADRWRIVDSLGYEERWWDPYNQNVLKADKPLHGEWFFNLGVISDTVYEFREVPTPVGGSTTGEAGRIDVFGGSDQWAAIQNLAMEFVYYEGDTVFRPPDYEFRFTPVFNYNYTELDEVLGINVDPRDGTVREDNHIGIQAAFVDKHLRNVSDRFDFDSFRIGIQPFSSDFRGFLFQDNQLGARLFGTRNNNVFQYNLAWFRRIEKDTNSGLNDLSEGLRDDDVFIANLFWQDMPVLGFMSQATVIYNRNRENEFHFDKNGFIQRPSSLGQERSSGYDVVYLGYNGDGHFGRTNLTTSLYAALGDTDSTAFNAAEADIEAFFAAAELSLDFNWVRPRLSFLYGSGDDDPFDDKAQGFDAIFENPQFAGADTSYWIRQAVPLIAGGRVSLSTRNGILNSLRSSKEEGQSNFVNPGIWLLGAGADFDVLPQLRVSLNYNWLRFDDTAVLEVARNQAGIDEDIGQDASISLIYRPLMSQNIVVRASYARLFADDGFNDLFPDEDAGYFLLNVVMAY